MQLLLFIICILWVGNCLEGVGISPIRVYHLNKGKFTKYLFSLLPQENIDDLAKLAIKFPAEIDQPTLAANPNCMVSR